MFHSLCAGRVEGGCVPGGRVPLHGGLVRRHEASDHRHGRGAWSGRQLDARQVVAVAYSSVKLLTSANTEHRCQGELRIASLTQHFDIPINCFQKTQAPFTTSTGWPRTDETGHQTFAGQREDTQKLTQVLVQDVRRLLVSSSCGRRSR